MTFVDLSIDVRLQANSGRMKCLILMTFWYMSFLWLLKGQISKSALSIQQFQSGSRFKCIVPQTNGNQLQIRRVKAYANLRFF